MQKPMLLEHVRHLRAARVNIDHESLEDNAVTVRNRDTWEQESVSIDELKVYLEKRLTG